MEPIVDGLEEEFSGRLTVLQLNVTEAENIQLLGNFGLRGHPSFALVDEGGKLSNTCSGPQRETQLREAIQLIVPYPETFA